jgi:hypothetical protein
MPIPTIVQQACGALDPCKKKRDNCKNSIKDQDVKKNSDKESYTIELQIVQSWGSQQGLSYHLDLLEPFPA